MKYLNLLILILFQVGVFSAQVKYEANWESIDSRPLPDWFSNAKFGIFIHFGPSSVPGWSPKGTYSEWYQYWFQNKTLFGNGDFTGSEVYDYHMRTYGENVNYYDFGQMFKADLFDPVEWASLFEKAGAKYIVITTKHHDGYCLWPSKEANDRGFPWNSVDIGPKRDIIGELSTAVKETDVKMGFYYSLYEWFHPWWLNNKERFINEHFHPQFKDLIISYEPDIIWGDGEWDLGSDKWKTPELIAWLYNDSPVKDKIVINDRWGKEIRKNHGGYFTTEYETGASFNRPWEECRGMGFSFGYNREEDIEDYNSAKTLVLMLCDIVSHGGNLLLDIGPDGRGKIPVIMQERLLQIGDWLNVNGEAIYDTKPWKENVQWTDGKREGHSEDQHYEGGDYILKQTIDVKEGYAAKEIFFTYKDENLFAIVPKWPGKSLTVKNINPTKTTRAYFLDSGEELKSELKDLDLIIHLPEYNPNIIRNNLAFAFRITEIKNFVRNVETSITYPGFDTDPIISMKCKTENAVIHYTLDGTDPHEKSNLYATPFPIKESTMIKARAFKKDHSPSDLNSFNAKVIKHVKNITSSINPSASYPGLGLVSLIDDVRGSIDYKDRKWLGFEGEDLELIFDFGKERIIDNLVVGCLEDQNSWIFRPKRIDVLSSDDGREYTSIGKINYDASIKNDDANILNLNPNVVGIETRFLKIRFNVLKKCPDWHKGAGGKTWLFIDEVIIDK